MHLNRPAWTGVALGAVLAAVTARMGPFLCGYSQQVALLPIGMTVFALSGALLMNKFCAGRFDGHDLPRPFASIVCALIVAVMPLLATRGLLGLRVTQPGQVAEIGQLVADPSPIPGGGVAATVVLSEKRLRLVAYGDAGRALAMGSAGSRYRVTGRTQSWDGAVPGWAISKHLAGRVTVKTASLVDHGSLPWRIARWVRAKVALGATGLPAHQRALFGGFVLGDDRGQDLAVADDFRASGLSHLLVVSGQNVAFVLTAANPILRRLPSTTRSGVAIVVIGGFALLTRFEPSVLRAATMAALVVLSRATYRPQEPMRVLSLAVMVLLIIDPLLAWSIGFGLSVCATAGLAMLASPLEERMSMRGVPDWLGRPLAATLAAQIGSYPLLLGLGGVSPVSIPANLLALPAAEPLMIWGVIIGVPAGVLGQPAATMLHSVDRVLIWWVAGVARWAGQLSRLAPLPLWWPLGVLAIAFAVRLAYARSSNLRTTVVAVATIAVALLAGTVLVVRSTAVLPNVRRQLVGTSADVNGFALTGTSALWRSGQHPVTILVARPGTKGAPLLQALRAERVNNLSALVVERPTNALWTALAPVLARHRADRIILCGASSHLGSTPIVGLGPDDTLHVQPDGHPWVVIGCQRGRAVVALQSPSAVPSG